MNQYWLLLMIMTLSLNLIVRVASILSQMVMALRMSEISYIWKIQAKWDSIPPNGFYRFQRSYSIVNLQGWEPEQIHHHL